ncbi:MAG: type III pantothenate kinase [Prevotellaceae bacterium]|nr:type III pantothenate kinase [Prevotellaceae bacterium]
MANLVVDIGNTATKLAVMEGNVVVDKLVDSSASFGEGRAFLAMHGSLPRAIISSVRRADDAATMLVRRLLPNAVTLTHATPLPIRNLYATPETLGCDRLAAAVGAACRFPGCNVLVVDAGTTITYELVSERGEYLGGNISPGITLRFKSLHDFTGLLPLCAAAAAAGNSSYSSPGRSTREAITAGVLNGVAYEVEVNVEQFALKYSNLKVVFTGGDADFLAKRIKKPIFVDYDLVLIGLNRILERLC